MVSYPGTRRQQCIFLDWYCTVSSHNADLLVERRVHSDVAGCKTLAWSTERADSTVALSVCTLRFQITPPFSLESPWTYVVPFAVVNVERGTRYRLRIFALACRPFFTFSIDNHNITFMEADGIEHDPVEV